MTHLMAPGGPTLSLPPRTPPKIDGVCQQSGAGFGPPFNDAIFLFRTGIYSARPSGCRLGAAGTGVEGLGQKPAQRKRVDIGGRAGKA